jgi:hypothetical protein
MIYYSLQAATVEARAGVSPATRFCWRSDPGQKIVHLEMFSRHQQLDLLE